MSFRSCQITGAWNFRELTMRKTDGNLKCGRGMCARLITDINYFVIKFLVLDLHKEKTRERTNECVINGNRFDSTKRKLKLVTRKEWKASATRWFITYFTEENATCASSLKQLKSPPPPISLTLFVFPKRLSLFLFRSIENEWHSEWTSSRFKIFLSSINLFLIVRD